MTTETETQQHLYSRPPLDPNAEDSLAKIARRIPHDSTVLDVGCAVGVLGQYLTEQQNCSVDGIEGNVEAAKIARPFYRRIMVTDLESADLRQLLEEARYDRIVCADVLEHLRDPGQVLQRLKDHLTPDGKILISIPNIGHIGVFLELLSGDFRYREEGLLDRTHLRFFTRRSFLYLLAENGFAGQIVDRTIVDLQHSEFSAIPMEIISPSLLREMQDRDDAITYQFIVEAYPQKSGENVTPIFPLDKAVSHGPRFACQVFWRGNDELFTETRSERILLPIGLDRQRVHFTFPKGLVQALRFDPSDWKGFLRLYAMRLLDGTDCLWTWDGDVETLLRGSLHGIFPAPLKTGEEGMVLSLLDDDPWLELPVSPEIISRAEHLEVELSWPMSADYLAVQEEWEDILKKNQRLATELESMQQTNQVQADELTAALRAAEEQNQRLATELESMHQSNEVRTEELTAALQSAEDKNQRLATELEATLRSHSWKLTKPLRITAGTLRASIRASRLLLTPGKQGHEHRYAFARTLYHHTPLPGRVKRALRNPAKRLLTGQIRGDYETWIRQYDTLTDADRADMRTHIASFTNPPIFSVVMPTYNPPEKFLRKAIESVRAQIYPHWELCIADDASPLPHVRRVLEEYARKDPRIKVVFREQNGHISVASNSALEVATGDYVALLDHDDALAEHALYWMAAEIMAHPEAELLYSDEDKISKKDRRCDPYFKPDWNPELLLGQNYISHLGVYKKDRVLRYGGFRQGFEGSQDWDLVLRFTEDLSPEKIRHIPAVLYHWRILDGSTASDLSAKPYVVNAAKMAITESLQRRGETFFLDGACNSALHLPRFSVNGTPKVSIIIPTRNGLSDLRKCLNSLNIKEYPYSEILVIDNQSDDADTLAYLADVQRRPGYRVLSYPYPFDYATMHNWAVPQANGEYICLLNNDTEVITPQWLNEMLGQAQRQGVGAVGAKLLYADGTVQHGGVILGLGGIASHAHKHFPGDSHGHFGRAALVQNFSAVTGACLMMRKSHWDQAGGMASELSVAFNDVDLCLRLREAGLRNVWLPHVLLYHHESKSRGSDIHPEKLQRFAREHAYMQWRWGGWLKRDPAYNPNLTLEREDFSLAWRPRVQYPWRREPAIIDVPYGIPHMRTEPLVLASGEEFQGSFPIPVGIRGMLTGISILIGNYGGASNGTLILHLQDGDGHSAHAHSALESSQDNAVLPMPFTQGEISLQGQDRLFFHLRLEGATHPVAFWVYALNDRWGHQIPGHEDRALRIELQVHESGA
ncbi:MAG: glycosyltransferase [Acidithiobacillus sp.]|nr:glycosyltransferase [Acidithiobacillus sp.]